MKNNATAKRNGYWVTMPAMCALKKARLPLKNVSPIHAIPKMPTIAFMPAPKTLPFTASCTLALPTSRMTVDMAIMTTSMVSGIPMRTVSPSTIKDGRSEGTEPNITIMTTATRNAITEYFARGLGCSSICSMFLASCSGLMMPSFTLRRYSGSSTSSFPIRF